MSAKLAQIGPDKRLPPAAPARTPAAPTQQGDRHFKSQPAGTSTLRENPATCPQSQSGTSASGVSTTHGDDRHRRQAPHRLAQLAPLCAIMRLVVSNICDGVLLRQERRLERRLAVGVVTLIVTTITSGCANMTEPPHFPAAIRNMLDEPIEIHEYPLADPEMTALVVQLDPGDIHELPSVGNQCYGEGLVALGVDGEVGQMDRCAIGADEVWVLHAEGNYGADYVGDDTYYWRE